MKKLLTLALALILLLGLAACFDRTDDNPTTVPQPTTTQMTTDAPETSATEEPTQNPLLVYVPGSIQLEPSVVSDYSFTPTKRQLYYTIPGHFFDLVPEGTITELFEKDKVIGVEPQEMLLVTLVKHSNISRQDFDKAVDEYTKMSASLGLDMTNEEFEIPNADVIYTFDNEIIDEYYRRD